MNAQQRAIAAAMAAGGRRGVAGYVAGTYEFMSGDNFKLTRDTDENWGWREDGNLNFDISELPPETREAVEEALRRNGGELTADGRIRHEDMDETIIDIIAESVLPSPQTEPGVFQMGPETTEHAFASMAFVSGTERFVQISSIAAAMMLGGMTNNGIEAMQDAMLAAQGSGLLIQNGVNIGPFDPNDPIIYPGEGDRTLLTSPPGHRFRLNRYGEPTNLPHDGADFAVYREDWSRYIGGEVGVRSRENSFLQLRMNDVFGLQAVSTGSTIEGQYSHLHANTVMDYLAAFGTQGVTATGSGLSGVPAGMRLGSIGNTGGESTATHLDLITRVLVDPRENIWEVQDPTVIYPALAAHPEWDWSRVYAGHQDELMMPNTLMDIYEHNGMDVNSFMPWLDPRVMAPDTINRAMELIMRDRYGIWQS